MTRVHDATEVASALQLSVGLLVRRLRAHRAEGEPTMPEFSALARLDRGGASTAAALAKREQISPQSMGATLSALEARGLVERRPDPDDRRQALISVTDAGRQALRSRRTARAERIARALEADFTLDELERLMAAAPLIARLAESV
jgi:DNA-binding MarR family transcriptional regulator